MSLSEQAQDRALDRSEEILQIFADTFGDDDPKTTKSFDRYTKMINDPNPYAARLAQTYLEWCLNHPMRINGIPHTKPCRCEEGFIHEGDGRYIPCPKCLPKTHDKWAGRSDDDLDADERPMI